MIITDTKFAIPGEIFFFQKGDVKTDFPWSRPDHLKMRAFFQDVKDNTRIMKKFDLYILGGVLWDYKTTWDLDINLVGKIEDYETLEEVMSELYELALNKHRILIDVSWVSRLPINKSYQAIKNNNFMGEDIDSIRFSYTKKQVGGTVTEVDLQKTSKKEDIITKNLVKNNWSSWRVKKSLLDKLKIIEPKEGLIFYPVTEFLKNTDEHFYSVLNKHNKS